MKDNRGNIINNPQTTASEVNEFFTNIVPSLAAIIPHVSVDHKSYSEWFFCGLFLHLTYYSWKNINIIVASLKSSNSEGVDCININVIKESIDGISPVTSPFLLVVCLIDSKSVR